MTTCEVYEEYGQGAIEEARFVAHAGDCSACQQLLEEDRKLLEGAATLRPAVRDGGDIWAGVSGSGVAGALDRARWKRPAWRYGRIAAVLLAGLGIWQLVGSGGDGSRLLLHGEALARVEQAERAYVEAIEALATQAGVDEQGDADELGRLLADRLAVIDVQIARCREAARQNPGNPQVRQYLLAALQEKEATLREVTSRSWAEQGEAGHDERG